MKNVFLAFLISLSFSLLSQTIKEFDNSTPRKTVQSHFYFLSTDNYKPEVAVFTLAKVNYTSKKRKQLIVKLKAILKKHNVIVENIPDSKRLIFSANKYVFFEDMPEVYLERQGKSWVYSEETVKSINKLYKEKVYRPIIKSDEIKLEIVKSITKKDSTQNDSTKIDFFNISTPYNAIITHILYLEDSLYNPELASKTINFTEEDSENKEELAIKLKQIYLGAKHRVLNFETLSKDSNYIDSTSQRHIFIPNPRFQQLYLEKVGDKWLYSASTSKLINSVHKEMFDEDVEQIFAFSDKFKLWIGKNYSDRMGAFEKWQVLMMAYFFSIFILLDILLIFVLKSIIFRIKAIDRYKKVLNKVLRYIILFLYVQISEVYIPSIALTLDYSHILHMFVDIVAIYMLTVIALGTITFFRLYLTRESTIDSKHGIVIFSALIIKSIIIITSILMMIKSLDFDLFNVLAGLSIGGFAIALGAQDSIRNFFGSLMIFADHPFSVGDYITDGKMYGTVEEVGLRTTRIRTLHGSILTIPNSKLSDNNIDNLGKRKHRRFKTKIQVDFNTDSKKLSEFIERIEQAFLNQPNSKRDYYVINLNDFALYGIEVLINVFFTASEWKLEMKYKQEFMLEIIDIAKELEIQFAVPPK